MIYNTLHIKLTIEQHKEKRGFNSGAPEEWAVPVPLVTPVVLVLLQTVVRFE